MGVSELHGDVALNVERVAEMLQQKRINTANLAHGKTYFDEGVGPRLINDNQKKVVEGKLPPQEKVAWLIHFYNKKRRAMNQAGSRPSTREARAAQTTKG